MTPFSYLFLAACLSSTAFCMGYWVGGWDRWRLARRMYLRGAEDAYDRMAPFIDWPEAPDVGVLHPSGLRVIEGGPTGRVTYRSPVTHGEDPPGSPAA